MTSALTPRGSTWQWRRTRETYAAQLLPTPCGKCGEMILHGQPFVLGHVIDRALGGTDADGLQLEHKHCSNVSGGRLAAQIAAARRAHHKDEDRHHKAFSLAAGQTCPPAVSCVIGPLPAFDPASIRGVKWLANLARRPADSSWPLLCSPVPADAVGSYGMRVEKWVREQLGIRFRHWQRFALRLQLAHRTDGSLCFGTVVESTPRRAGKSVRLRALALYRTAQPDLFGEQQLVVLIGKDAAICLEHHKKCWPWAMRAGWAMSRRTGAEEMLDPASDSRFIVRSQQAVFGYDVSYGIVDEAWGVPDEVVSDGLEPSLLDRANPQLHLVSTSHARATSLMRTRIEQVVNFGFEDPSVLLMLWAAPPDADVSDPATWRSASPFWTPERERFIARKYEQALAGQGADLDEPDPVRSFVSQYCNGGWWLPRETTDGMPVVTAAEWDALEVDAIVAPTVVAVESSLVGGGVSVACAEQLDDGRAGVSVTGFDALPMAAAWVQALIGRGARVLLAGRSMATDPLLPNAEPMSSTSRAAAVELRRLVDDNLLVHDGSPLLAEQVLALRQRASSEGPRLVSKARADAVKAAVWAAGRARTALDEPWIY